MSRITQDICGMLEPAEARVTNMAKVEGWVLYDADCRFCVGTVKRFENLLAARHFQVLPLQTPWVVAKLGMEDARLLAEMRLLLPDGTNFGGADALIEISRRYWWAWPFHTMARFPAVKKLLRWGYGWLALRRNCAGGACGIRKAADGNGNLRFTDFLPLLILPLAALFFRNRAEAWVFMWLMAFALYAGCKWLTFRQAAMRGLASNFPRSVGYLLAWPGMDAVKFLDEKCVPAKPRATEWVLASAKTVFGVVLLWEIARTAFPAYPIIAGWIGMTGVVFILHFGLFHILSLAWRQAGVTATPVMQNPILSCSLAEFWGRRWNTAFNELAFRFTFRPFLRLTTPAIAALLVFGLSGLVHDLVISLPARGGYGLPTAYFLLQGAGLAAQRTKPGRRFGLDRGGRGWLFTMLVTTVPAFWLFHPPFITNVILPMLARIGAT